MPDMFYNKKKKALPLKIYTAMCESKNNFDDFVNEWIMILHYRYDLSLPSLLNKAMIKAVHQIKNRQFIPSEAIDDFGVELCVAHTVLHLGGAVKLNGSNEWIGKIAGAKNLLPITRMKNFKVEGIDLSGSNVMYEGLEYLPSLSNLKELRLSTAPFVDDHCLRRIARMRRHLEYLDISNCPQISGKGLAALWSARNLKVLNVSNNPFLEDKELVCILLTEKNPQLQIKGVDFFKVLNPEQKSRLLQLYDKENVDKVKATESEDNIQLGNDITEEKRTLTES